MSTGATFPSVYMCRMNGRYGCLPPHPLNMCILAFQHRCHVKIRVQKRGKAKRGNPFRTGSCPAFDPTCCRPKFDSDASSYHFVMGDSYLKFKGDIMSQNEALPTCSTGAGVPADMEWTWPLTSAICLLTAIPEKGQALQELAQNPNGTGFGINYCY